MADLSDVAARRMATEFLDRTGRGLMQPDFELFADAFHIPLRMATSTGSNILRTRQELRHAFDCARARLSLQGVTEVVRDCIAAAFKGPDRMDSTHVTHLLVGDRRIEDPYPTYTVFCRLDGRWKITSTDVATTPTSMLGRIFDSQMHHGTERTDG